MIKGLKDILLSNMEETREVISQINSYDGSLEFLEYQLNDEDFFNAYFENKPEEAVRAAFYGDYRYMDEYVKFNGYGNLESKSEYQVEKEIKSYIDEVVERVEELHQNIWLPSEIEEYFESLED